MTRQEMIAEVASRTGETAEVVASFVDDAGEAIINYIYPFRGEEALEVPLRYHRRQVEIATYLVNKRGAEGETKHNENGTDRTYEEAEIPKSYFKGLMPCGYVPLVEDEEDENP